MSKYAKVIHWSPETQEFNCPCCGEDITEEYPMPQERDALHVAIKAIELGRESLEDKYPADSRALDAGVDYLTYMAKHHA